MSLADAADMRHSQAVAARNQRLPYHDIQQPAVHNEQWVTRGFVYAIEILGQSAEVEGIGNLTFIPYNSLAEKKFFVFRIAQ